MGLGLVGVEELLANPSQRQIIPLLARPYEPDEVTGTLTVEVKNLLFVKKFIFYLLFLFKCFLLKLQFLFIEGAEVPQIGTKPYKVKETIKPPTPNRTYSPTNLHSNSSLNYNNGNSTLILYDSTAQSTGGNYRL